MHAFFISVPSCFRFNTLLWELYQPPPEKAICEKGPVPKTLINPDLYDILNASYRIRRYQMKRLLALLLILVMICSVMAACGSSGSGEAADSEAAGTEAVEPEATDSEAAESEAPAGDPAVIDKFVGQWASEQYSGAFVYTFNADGTGNYDASGTDMPFTYTIEDNNLSILYDGDTFPFETTFVITDTTLTIKDSFDEDVVYNKL
jgi:hypothetical protein